MELQTKKISKEILDNPSEEISVGEFVFLLMLIPKYEVRGNKKGCRDNLKAIFGDKEICDLLQKTPVTISEKSNCLIYQVMKHPTGLWITLLQAALAVHDR